jgi:hypothetical protein
LAEPVNIASRFAALDRTRAIALGLLLFALLVAGIWSASVTNSSSLATATSSRFDEARPQGNEDLALYDKITTRVAAGENYYRATAEELRRGGYPLKPFFAFRLPTLAVAAAWIGLPALRVLQWCLFAAMIGAWWVSLDKQFADNGRRVSAAMLAAAGVAVAFSGRYVLLHEIWAGTLIAVSLALHRRDRWGWSVACAALALAIRELALPYVLLMAALAFYYRSWRELGAWVTIILLFAAGMAWHSQEVARVILPSDPASPGWSSLGGWAGALRTFHLTGPLRWLPPEVGAAAIILTLFGWLSWKSPTGLAATLMYAGYGVAFMLFGRANNFYWGFIVTPAFLVGLAFLPRALSDLASAARAREAGIPA